MLNQKEVLQVRTLTLTFQLKTKSRVNLRTTRCLRPLSCPLPSCFLKYVKFNNLGTNPALYFEDQKYIFQRGSGAVQM